MITGTRERIRFWRRVEQGALGCWIWKGGTRENGYGSFAIKTNHGRWTQTTAHRWSYQDFGGHVPEGWEVDHLCKVRNCVRPDHLEAVTLQENRRRRDIGYAPDIDRGVRALPEFYFPPAPVKRDVTKECKNGHFYADTGWAKNGKSMTCAQCRKDREAKRLKGGSNGTKTECPQGHPYSEENTDFRVRADGSKSRDCKICRRARNNAYKAKTRAR